MLLAPIEQMPLFINSPCKQHREFAVKMLEMSGHLHDRAAEL